MVVLHLPGPSQRGRDRLQGCATGDLLAEVSFLSKIGCLHKLGILCW